MPFIPDKPNQPSPGFVPDQPSRIAGIPDKDLTNPLAGEDGATRESMMTGMIGMGGISRVGAEAGGLAKMLGSVPGKFGDWAMQKAVGMKKFIPGVGKTLADEGVVGTRNMMANQVESAMAKRGSEIGNLSSSLKDVPTDVASQHVLDRANRLIQSDGYINPADQSKYQAYMDIADNIADRGSAEGVVSGKIAAESRSSAGVRAREAGAYRDSPSEALKSKLASSEQAGWSQALKDTYAQTHPNQANKLAEADLAYSNLAKANKPLSAPQSISQAPVMTKYSQIPGSSLGLSTLGRLGIGTSKLMGSQGASAIGTQGAAKLGDLLNRKQSYEDR